jgi:hypothetical protein
MKRIKGLRRIKKESFYWYQNVIRTDGSFKRLSRKVSTQGKLAGAEDEASLSVWISRYGRVIRREDDLEQSQTPFRDVTIGRRGHKFEGLRLSN